jgi:hypothetical protein
MGGPDMAPQPPQADTGAGGRDMGPQPRQPHTPQVDATPRQDSGPSAPVLAIVKDLFWVARIRETARLAEVAVTMVRSPEEVEAALTPRPRFALLDLTAGFDYERLFRSLDGAGVPVLAFTTHALAPHTKPWHPRCARVVTKETLTAELPRLLREGVAA